MEDKETDQLLAAQDRLKKVEDATRENLAKVLNRGDNLADLERRADNLTSTAREFNYTATRVKRKMCWQNVKLWFILLFILIVILAVLIVALVSAFQHKKK